jgi:hypothetical protein
LSKTFQRPLRAIRCRKIAMYKHHFYQVISPVKSHPKMGHSRKDPYSPHGGNFCHPEGEGRKNCFW